MRSATILFVMLMAGACADAGWIPTAPVSGPDEPVDPDIRLVNPDQAPPGEPGEPDDPSLRMVDRTDRVESAAPDALLVESGLLQMTFAVLEGGGVEGVSFTIGAVACPGGDDPEPFEPISGKRALEPMLLPDGDPADPPNPLAGHRFADIFSTVPPGCYEVTMFPLDSEGEIVDDCTSAHLPNVEVLEGETTEVLAISQCEGEPVGGLDVIAAVNHPPQIEDFWFRPSKFVFTCETARLCVSATDPDGDDLEFVWEVHGDPAPAFGPVTSSNWTTNGIESHCVDIAMDEPSSVDVTVTIFDRLGAEWGGRRIEDALAEQGGGMSRDWLTVPLHTAPDFDNWCVERDGSLGRPERSRLVNKNPSCTATSLSEHYCDAANPDVAVDCPGGEFDPEAVFDPCVCSECVGGINALEVRWNGPGVKLVLLRDSEGRIVMCQYLAPGQRFAFQGKFEDAQIGDFVTVRIGDEARFQLATDCGEELLGFERGGFEIVDGSSAAGSFCLFPPDPGADSKP